jgi:hypothetical protein
MLGAPAAPKTNVPFGSLGLPPALEPAPDVAGVPDALGALLAAPPVPAAAPPVDAALVGLADELELALSRLELAQLAIDTARVSAIPTPTILDRLTLANLQVGTGPLLVQSNVVAVQ